MRIHSAMDDIFVVAVRTVTWDQIANHHPGLYGSEYEPEEGEEEETDPYGHGSAASSSPTS